MEQILLGIFLGICAYHFVCIFDAHSQRKVPVREQNTSRKATKKMIKQSLFIEFQTGIPSPESDLYVDHRRYIDLCTMSVGKKTLSNYSQKTPKSVDSGLHGIFHEGLDNQDEKSFIFEEGEDMEFSFSDTSSTSGSLREKCDVIF